MTDAKPTLELDFGLDLGTFRLRPRLSTHSRRVALFGPSGSGKTLTLEVIAGLAQPDDGAVRVLGNTLFDAAKGSNLSPQRRHLGYVPQQYHLFPHMTVAENVRYGLRGRRRNGSRVGELLEVVGLVGLEGRYPRQLSGGQQQRVAFARALAGDPQLLLLDEPFSALDEVVRAQLRLYLAEMLERIGTPTLLVTHDLTEATMLADTLAVMRHGAVVQMGTGEDLLLRPADAQVAELVGMSNRLTGEVASVEADGMTVAWEGHLLKAPATAASVGSRVTLGIRPENVLLPPLGAPGEGMVVATIARTMQEGLSFRVKLTTDAGSPLEMLLSQRIYRRYGLRPGQRLAVRLEPHYLWPLTEVRP